MNNACNSVWPSEHMCSFTRPTFLSLALLLRILVVWLPSSPSRTRLNRLSIRIPAWLWLPEGYLNQTSLYCRSSSSSHQLTSTWTVAMWWRRRSSSIHLARSLLKEAVELVVGIMHSLHLWTCTQTSLDKRSKSY